MAADMNAPVFNIECKTCVLMYVHAYRIDMECKIPSSGKSAYLRFGAPAFDKRKKWYCVVKSIFIFA